MRNYFTNPKNVKRFLDWIAEERGIKEQGDWYRISNSVINKYFGAVF